jgi:hypothetical protein
MKARTRNSAAGVVALLLGAAGASANPAAATATTPAGAAPAVSPETARALALNRLDRAPGGWRLEHPRHAALFDAHGVRFDPRRGPSWSWRLAAVTSGGAPTPGVALVARLPPSSDRLRVAYDRGGLVEEYVLGAASIEQRFVLPRPLAAKGDLEILGTVESPGRFAADGPLASRGAGWSWRLGEGGVRLGEVRVFDAAGRELPATMSVTATSTRIRVAAADLAAAAYPVVIDPEIGADDFLISDMGTTGDPAFPANHPDVAYNPVDNEYLVVWNGEDNVGGTGDNDVEIFCQLLDAATGAEIGLDDFRISNMGNGSATYGAFEPTVVWNPVHEEYLVVWHGDDNVGGLVNDELEIFGQRLDAVGTEIGADDFRISDMGGTGDVSRYGRVANLAWSSVEDEYLVVWVGDDDVPPLVDDEREVFGQLLDASGAEIGANDFRITDAGGLGNTFYHVYQADVAYNSTANEYLVVFSAEDTVPGMVDNEVEIFGQRLDADGAEVGVNDFRISEMGPSDTANYGATFPAVAHNSIANEYLVVFRGIDNVGGLVFGEYEIFGQRLDGTGAQVGADDFRISEMGGTGNVDPGAHVSAVAYDPNTNTYLVVWDA